MSNTTPTEPPIDSDEQPPDQSQSIDEQPASRSKPTAEPGTDRPQSIDSGSDLHSSTVRRYLAWAALGVCSVLALFALVQFYGSVTDAIGLWIEPRHQPLMGAAFNLAVLLASLVGVSLVVRELS